MSREPSHVPKNIGDVNDYDPPLGLTINTLSIGALYNPQLSNMASARLVVRSSRTLASAARPFSSSSLRLKDLNERGNDTTAEWRKKQTEKPLNPHLTNTTSTIANKMPRVGRDAAPPEMLSSVDPNFAPKDAAPKNTATMTGGTQAGSADAAAMAELGVGELEGAQFKIEPIRRTGEDINTMRARLTCEYCSNILACTF